MGSWHGGSRQNGKKRSARSPRPALFDKAARSAERPGDEARSPTYLLDAVGEMALFPCFFKADEDQALERSSPYGETFMEVIVPPERLNFHRKAQTDRTRREPLLDCAG